MKTVAVVVVVSSMWYLTCRDAQVENEDRLVVRLVDASVYAEHSIVAVAAADVVAADIGSRVV